MSNKRTRRKHVSAPISSEDSDPGWFWRTSEGKRIIAEGKEQRHTNASGSNPLDDPELGWQREED